MGQTSKDVKAEMVQIHGRMSVIEKKIDVLHGAIKNVFNVLADLETRSEIVKTLGIRKDIFAEVEYESVWNEIRGYVSRTAGSEVQRRDIVCISYTMRWLDVNGIVCSSLHPETKENLVFVVGSKAVIFDDVLVGLKVGEKSEIKDDEKGTVTEITVHYAKHSMKALR